MKNKDLAILSATLMSVGKYTGIKFAYAVAKNIRLIDPELKIFQDLLKPSEDFAKYEVKRIKLCEAHAEKNDKGKSKIIGNKYIILDQKKFDKELQTLKDSNKKVVDDREQKIKEYNNLMEEESKFKPYKIKMKFIPKEITVAEINGIFDLIEPEKEEK